MKGLVLTVLMFNVTAAVAKAPVLTYGSQLQKRYPAQYSEASVDKYLDMSCYDFYDESSNDEFVKFFRKELDKLRLNFCDIVFDDFREEDERAQYERENVGLGTFSKLLETHYQEFTFQKKLDYYQSRSCDELTDKNSKDEFVKFFRGYTSDLNPNFCDYVQVDGFEMDSDISQAERDTIGQGTFSKIIEDSFSEYYYKY